MLVPLAGTSLYGNWTTSRVIRDRAIESSRNDIRLRAGQIAGFLNGVHGDILYLAHLDSTRHLADARSVDDPVQQAEWRAELMHDMLIFSASRPNYYQIRYLTESGEEYIRIDSDGLVSRIVPVARLQDKADRYYFREGMNLPPSGVSVSALDLNREEGVVEDPPVPVIRYGTPIFDDEGSRRGLMAINVFAERFLSMLAGDEGDDSSLMMVDQDGYYLAQPDSNKQWGGPNDLNTGQSAVVDYGSKSMENSCGHVGQGTCC